MGWFKRFRTYLEYVRWAKPELRAALALEQAGHTEEAVRHLRPLLEGAPHAAPVALLWQIVGALNLKLERYEEAEPALRQAEALFRETVGLEHPDARDVQDHLSTALLHLGRWADALAMSQSSLQIKTRYRGLHHPSLALPLHRLAQIAVAQDDPAAAFAHLTRALAVQEQAPAAEQDAKLMVLVLHDLVVLEEAAGNRDQALAHLQRGLDLVRDNAPDAETLALLRSFQDLSTMLVDGSLRPDRLPPRGAN